MKDADKPSIAPTASQPTPPDDAKIQALLQMAEMQSMGGKASHRPYRNALIVSAVVIALMLLLYVAVVWASHHYA